MVGVAAALQSAAKPGTALVGPSTRAAAEEFFKWGPSQDIPMPSGTHPPSGSYLVGARPRSVAEAGRRRLAARATLVGRRAELAVLTGAVRAAVAGKGWAVVVIAGVAEAVAAALRPCPGAGIVHGAKDSKGSDAPRTQGPGYLSAACNARQ